MTHPHNGPGPAVPPACGGHRTAPGGPGPGVPLSIWPDLPAPCAGSSPGPCAGPVTAAAAGQIITAFSRPGDLVTVPDGSAAIIEAAAAAGRHVLGLIPDPVRDGRALAGLRARLDPAARLRPGGPALLLAPGDPDAGQAALAIAGCHGPGCCASDPDPAVGDGPGTGLLYAACQRVLRAGYRAAVRGLPAGAAARRVLAVITASPAPDARLADQAGPVVSTARAADLVYAQHIVLVHAVITGTRLVPHSAAGLPVGSRAHSDLLVFTKPGGTTRHE